eukprot:TRINITY_DN10819_c0_g1_i3.p1 TRINITY_DN10819_c0_g1~~TRINITY_DN10819_c0_g1_i3.p1  ORF type:complete len:542 (+),score=95.87 TRINITY_DN10819_c0_g1_i3:51-1676(+)
MPRPITSPSKEAQQCAGNEKLPDDANTAAQFDCMRAQLRSLEQGQLDMREILQRIEIGLKSDKFVKVGMAEKQQATTNDAIKERGRLNFVESMSKHRRETLRRIFEVAEEIEQDEIHIASAKESYMSYLVDSAKSMSRYEVEAHIDIFIGVVIMANAIFIGVGMDYKDDNPAWLAIDVLFSLIFISELIFKIWVHGFLQQFFGSSALSNCFDAVLIMLDLAQLIIELTSPRIAEELDSAPSASLFRVVRLLRLTRLVRALKADVFRSLAEMIHGIAAGMTTLIWSFVLFFLFLYVVSLVLRESLGRGRSDSEGRSILSIHEMFDSVPRSIFTTFRCSFGDCTFRDGSPIFESVLPQHGVGWVVFYSMAIFIVSIVLFNVISAMFVERTMAAATALTMEKKRARLQDEKHLFSKVTLLIKHIMEFAPNIEAPETKLSTSISEVMKMEVPLSVMDEAINDPYVKSILNELDINPQDHRRLTDIFDPDNGGTVELADVAIGIRRMRGDPRRSDIVCVDLMVRSMQTVLHETLTLVKEIRNALHD